MSSNIGPSLIDEGVKTYLGNKLIGCHEYKMTIYSYFMNTIYFIGMVLIFVVILYFSRNPKMTPYEKAVKMQKEQEYIVSKIRDYREEKQKYSSLITDLPVFQGM